MLPKPPNYANKIKLLKHHFIWSNILIDDVEFLPVHSDLKLSPLLNYCKKFRTIIPLISGISTRGTTRMCALGVLIPLNKLTRITQFGTQLQQ